MRVEYFPLKEDVILQNEAPTDLYIFVIGAAPHYEKVARLFNEPDAVHPGIILIARVDCGLKSAPSVAILAISTVSSWSPSQRIINLSTPTPHLRARAGNEHEEHTQIRICVQGLLNRLSESNVKSITGELSLIFQILTEEVLASCSSGPRGNQQLRIFALLFYSYLPQ
ncbi:hypothetical protein JHK87_004283 [Glycine soja]|nr:hypothetical protein JHK87_004283 [Glycine soja]